MSGPNSPKKFMNLTPAECLDVYPMVAQNAREFYSSANLLAESKHYGKAISFRILGAEEYIKSLCLLLDGYGCNTRNIPKVVKIFGDHESRHKISRDFLPVWLVLKHLVKFRLNNKWRQNVAIVFKAGLSAFTYSSMIDWWNSANSLKNEGFYVNYINEVISPAKFTASDYDRAKRYTAEIASVLKELQGHLSSLDKKGIDEFQKNFQIAEFDKLIEASLLRK